MLQSMSDYRHGQLTHDCPSVVYSLLPAVSPESESESENFFDPQGEIHVPPIKEGVVMQQPCVALP